MNINRPRFHTVIEKNSNRMKNTFSLLFLAFVLASCEQIIDIEYKENQSKIIIEGNITNSAGPYLVKITKSLSLEESGPYPTIDDAVVSIADDAGNSETLTPLGNGTYTTTAILGTEGRTYTLTVDTENQRYTAQSKMPALVPFDAIQVDEVTVMGEIEYNLIPKYFDPSEKGNKYQFILTVNDTLVSQHFVQNDDIENGVVNTRRLEINDNDLKLKQGDRVSVKMQCIDASVSSYYTALALMADSGPGGGVTPNNPPSNISNGALGIFSAHTVGVQKNSIP